MIWVGDIGDNRDSWPYARIHKVIEPARLVDADVPVTTYRFTYPDGPVNAEALMADPKRERLWVISKEDGVGGVYALPSPMSDSRTPMEAEKVGTARSQVTDAAMAPGGKRFVVRDYLSAEVFTGKPPGQAQARFGLPLQPQGEAVTWTADGKGLIVASERSGELIQVDVPRTALGTDGGIAGALPRVAGFDIYPYVRIAAVALAALIALVVLRRSARRRRRRQVARLSRPGPASGRAARRSGQGGDHVVDRAGQGGHVGRVHRREHRHAQLVAARACGRARCRGSRWRAAPWPRPRRRWSRRSRWCPPRCCAAPDRSRRGWRTPRPRPSRTGCPADSAVRAVVQAMPPWLLNQSTCSAIIRIVASAGVL